MNQLTLFDLTSFTQHQAPIYDSSWDSYDDTQEPPDPDDYPTLGDYETAWNEWNKTYPNLVSQAQAMTVLEQDISDTQQAPNADYTVLEQEKFHTNKVAPEQCHWVEKYKVVRYYKEHYYYRYIWMSGRKLHHVHIGGNVNSSMAAARKKMVQDAISDGRSPVQIKQMLRGFKNEYSTMPTL